MRSTATLIEPVLESTTGGQIYDRFNAEPEALAIAVVDEAERPVGLVERQAFFLRMAAEFGRALYGNRPITTLMDRAPLIVEAKTPVAGFLARAVTMSPSDLMHGFIIVEEGRYYGIGTALGLLVAANDESRRKAAEMQALAKSFRLLFDDNPVPMYVFARDTHRVLRVNDAAVSQFGVTRKALLNSRVTDFIAPEYRDRSIQRLRGGSEARETSPYPIMDGEGRMRIVVSYLRPMTFEDAPAILSATVDISDREAAVRTAAEARDAAEAANRAKSEFLANMSHEIRTPLNGVIGVASRLARTELTERQSEMVGLIEHSAESLQVLLSDILDLARIEAGRLDIADQPFQLGQLVRQIGELFRPRAEDKSLAFEIDCRGLDQLGLSGDPARLKQILGNLISNAVKFTATGKVRLDVCGDCNGDRAGLRFAVRDTGIGFDEETRQRLFSRFEQGDGSVARRFGGAGLGLAISRNLAEAMGGTLDATSIPGAGSTFTFEVGLALAPAAEAVPAPSEPAAFEQPLRILLADDHPVNRKVVGLMLEDANVELVCAEDGSIALDLFQSDRFDVVLMDMQMPNMDGLEATRAIRALETRGAGPRTPVIMLSANALPEHIAAGRAAGADLYLTKPIAAGDLYAAIEAAISTPATAAVA